MKRVLKTILPVIVLGFIVIVSGFIVQARGETSYEVEGGKLWFDASKGEITWADEEVTSAVIPDSIDGVAVTSIGEWAFCKHEELTSVTLPNTLKTIKKGAFWRCPALSSITIPESVTKIEKDAFTDCPGLVDINFAGDKSDISMKEAFDNWFYIGGDFSSSYKKGKYYKNLMNVKLTKNVRNNIINIAKSQYGYHEGSSNKDLSGKSKSTKDYTEYGYYHGKNPVKWCGEFAEWCIEMGGIPRSLLDEAYQDKFGWQDTKYAGKGGTRTVKKGDICRVTHSSGGHMILVVSLKKSGNTMTMEFRDGGDNNQVYHDTWKFDAKTGKGKGYYSEWKIQFFVTPDYDKLSFHTLNFDANGGSVKTKSRPISDGALYSIMPAASWNGHKFVGWFTEPEGGIQIKPYMAYGGGEDVTLYAHWK